ncbi:MAG: response regulator, partial [Desulfobacterales bacterium]
SSVGSMNLDLKKKLDISKYITKPAKQSKLFDSLMHVLRYRGSTEVQSVKVVTPEEANTRVVQHRILLVEDNLDTQRLAKKIMEKAGYLVDLAENGQQAVEATEKSHYDLILMDIQMPVMDGFKATKKIRELERRQHADKVPIVALTAHAMQGYREKCLRHDMDDYVTKPIRKKILFKTIEQWLDPRPVILVVDDSQDNRNLLKNYLMKSGAYRLLFARHGQEAVEICQRRNVFLILMDMEMPVMDGYRAASAIRNLENGADIPIIALTAHQGTSEMKKCLDAGCTAYLSKPIRKKELFEMLFQHLGSQYAENKSNHDKYRGVPESINS